MPETVAEPVWAHEIAVDGKESIKLWAAEQISTDGRFEPEDNGKFVVRVHDASKGLYNLCLVYKQKLTLHNMKIDPSGVATTIGKKQYGAFKTLDEVVAGLSTVPPPAKWPLSLIAGLDATDNTMRASSNHQQAQPANSPMPATVDAETAMTRAPAALHTPTDVGLAVDVSIEKGKAGFGLSFGGCKSPKHAADSPPGVYISAIAPGGNAAADPNVHVGWQILAANGVDMSQGTRVELKDVLAGVGATIKLTIAENAGLYEFYRSQKVRRESRKQSKRAPKAKE